MKKLGLIVVVTGLSFGVWGQNQSQYTGALLWKISGKDLKKPSYVLGTHHTIPTSYVDSIPGLRQTIAEVKQVVGEIDIYDPAKVAAVVMKYSMMPPGYSYKSLLSDNEYAVLDKELPKYFGVGMDNLGSLHPAAIALTLQQMQYIKLFPDMLNPDFEAFDVYIQKTARSLKKSVAGLETAEEQFEILFNSEPIEKQAKDILCVIERIDESLDDLIEITESYYQKQLDKIYELYYKDLTSDDDCAASEALLKALNSGRNQKWLTVLPQMMKKKTSLIAVGAGHLGGESGLLYKLNEMGYTVEAVK